MAAINSVVDLSIEGEVALVTINSPPVNALVASRPRRPQARRRSGGSERRRQGDRHHLRRADVHRRRRHFRIRQAPCPAQPARGARRHGERVEAGHRRDPRHGARRRIRGRADGALPHRRPVGEMRPAGDQARHSSPAPGARSACPASSAPRRRSTSFCPERRSARARPRNGASSTNSPRRESCANSAIAYAKRLIAEKAPLKKVRDRSDKIEPARGHPEIFEAVRKANARKYRGFEAWEGGSNWSRTRSTCRSTRAWRRSARSSGDWS